MSGLYFVIFFPRWLTLVCCTRFQEGGDAHTGRTLTGMPLGPDMCWLPPHFVADNEVDQAFILEKVKEVFPGASRRMIVVLEKLLASLVYHLQWIKETMPNSPVLRLPLFTGPGPDLTRLKQMLVCKILDPGAGHCEGSTNEVTSAGPSTQSGTTVTLTGVPAVAHSIFNQKEILRKMHEVRSAPSQAHQCGCSCQSADAIKEAVRAVLAEIIPPAPLAVSSEASSHGAEDASAREGSGDSHGGIIPPTFCVPNDATLLECVRLWVFGSRWQSVPPLMGVRLQDYARGFNDHTTKRNAKRRFCEFCRTMKTICGTGELQYLNESDLDSFFVSQIQQTLDIPAVTPSGRPRDRIHWRTVAKNLKAWARPQASSPLIDIDIP